MRIEIPKLAVVVLMGASGSGKSTFARKHFLPTEIVSSDTCRGLVEDDESSLDATNDAFDLVHYIAAKRLKRGKLVVIDATNVQQDARRPLLALAKQYHAVPVAIVINTPESVCHERNKSRPDRQFGPHVVRNHVSQLRRAIGSLRKERFRYSFVLKPEDLENIEIVRTPLWTDKSDERGPFDIIGDIHGCREELEELLVKLGYQKVDGRYVPPDGRKAVFLGDLADRGPDSPGVFRIVMDMVADGHAICVPGNHDFKLLNKLKGKDVNLNHGLDKTMEQLAHHPEEFSRDVKDFIESLISHYVLDGGNLVVAHAGMRADMQGRASSVVKHFAMFGETTGETDEFGLPVRFDWAREYDGNSMVVYGHTPVPEPEWLNRTINIDTGCVFGGSLTALRYPERELVSVPAKETYAEPSRPIGGEVTSLTAQHDNDDILDIGDVTGKRLLHTTLSGNLTIWAEQSIAALEVMSRFAMNPKWLVYLPPTMSPPATSDRDGFLEYPTEAFDYYQSEGVERVVCEEKHMGSRALVVVCKDESVALKRFGLEGEGIGAIATRTGRQFFESEELEQQMLQRLNAALEQSATYDRLATDWLVLDCELMPWSAKAQELLKKQYAQTGAAALACSTVVNDIFLKAAERGAEINSKQTERWKNRLDSSQKFVDAYRRYCWHVNSLEDYKLAPFHILASEGKAHVDKDHVWHMETIKAFASLDPLFRVTPYRTVDLSNEEEVKGACQWWEELVGAGGEGMVVKPHDFIARNGRGLLQPAVKCRGPEYLRIIYGPDYLDPANLVRLRKRGLNKKRSLAIREFSLGVEALTRFVNKEPLRRVHECVFGVLALESEPVDPRL